MQSESAVVSITLRPRSIASRWVIAGRNVAPGLVRGMAEEGRVAVRNVRRDVMRHLEELVRNGDVGDDEERAAEGRVQKLTDDHTGKIDDLLKHKEAEIMEV